MPGLWRQIHSQSHRQLWQGKFHRTSGWRGITNGRFMNAACDRESWLQQSTEDVDSKSPSEHFSFEFRGSICGLGGTAALCASQYYRPWRPISEPCSPT